MEEFLNRPFFTIFIIFGILFTIIYSYFFFKYMLSEWEATIISKKKRNNLIKILHWGFFNEAIIAPEPRVVLNPLKAQYILEYIKEDGRKGKIYTQYNKLINLEVGDRIVKKRGPSLPYKKLD
jgi:predicted membrane protein